MKLENFIDIRFLYDHIENKGSFHLEIWKILTK